MCVCDSLLPYYACILVGCSTLDLSFISCTKRKEANKEEGVRESPTKYMNSSDSDREGDDRHARQLQEEEDDDDDDDQSLTDIDDDEDEETSTANNDDEQRYLNLISLPHDDATLL
jgi:hypothetical protein